MPAQVKLLEAYVVFITCINIASFHKHKIGIIGNSQLVPEASTLAASLSYRCPNTERLYVWSKHVFNAHVWDSPFSSVCL